LFKKIGAHYLKHGFLTVVLGIDDAVDVKKLLLDKPAVKLVNETLDNLCTSARTNGARINGLVQAH